VIHQLDRPTHATVSPTPHDVPDDYSSAKVYHLAPMPETVQEELAAYLGPREALVTLDPFDEDVVKDSARWCASFPAVGGLFLSEDELRVQDDERKLEQALAGFRGGALRFVAFKRAARGGVLYDCVRDERLEWRGSGTEGGDPTGAGDAFAGGFLAGWIATKNYPTALEQGAVSASFALEGRGVRGLLAATPEKARRRLEEWFGARAWG